MWMRWREQALSSTVMQKARNVSTQAFHLRFLHCKLICCLPPHRRLGRGGEGVGGGGLKRRYCNVWRGKGCWGRWRNWYCNVLQRTATHCNTLQHTTSHCNVWHGRRCWDTEDLVLQHTATHCHTLQHTTTHCNALQRTAKFSSGKGALFLPCNTLQHPATPCNNLQHPATRYITLQHPATPCNTLQHLATPCNTLQHTAKTRRGRTLPTLAVPFSWRISSTQQMHLCVCIPVCIRMSMLRSLVHPPPPPSFLPV